MVKVDKTHAISRYIYPFLSGVFMFNVIRAVTDFTKKENFYEGDLSQHFVSLSFIIISCYIFDILWYRKLQSKSYLIKIKNSVPKEYIGVFFSVFIPVNITCLIGEWIGVFYMGDGIIDYMLVNVVLMPFFLLYYTVLRNEKMNKDYIEKTVQLEQIRNEQLEKELEYLKAQYHPHFLFNALNTVYFQIDEDKNSAKHTVELLSALLRYQLYSVKRAVIIEEEIGFIQQYVEFQKLRMSEDLQVKIETDPLLKGQIIQPLLFQPLLENAFKYVDGELKIDISFRLLNNCIHFMVKNSIMAYDNTYEDPKNKGIGIENLRRRLELLYPDKYQLNIEKKDKTFQVQLIIEIENNEHSLYNY